MLIRLFDIFFSLCITFFASAFAPIVLIFYDSPEKREIFYRQERIGRHVELLLLF